MASFGKILTNAKEKLGADRAAEKRQLSSRSRALIELNKQHYDKLSKNATAVANYKRAETENNILRGMDRDIYGAMHREGGILFYAEMLRRYTDDIMKEGSSIEQMHISAYNSAVAKMILRRERLERDVRNCEDQLKQLDEQFEDVGSIFVSLGYRRWTSNAKALGELLEEKLPAQALCEKAEPLMKELERAERENRKAAELSDTLAVELPEPYVMHNEGMLADVDRVLGDERVKMLANPEKFGENEYREILKSFSSFLNEKLLLRYWIED